MNHLVSGPKPLRAGSLYRSSIGDLTVEQYDDFRVLVDAATEVLLTGHTDADDEPGVWMMATGTGFQPEIHQAIGVIMAALEVDAAHALARLRGRAFAIAQPIIVVAHAIVGGGLRLECDFPHWPASPTGSLLHPGPTRRRTETGTPRRCAF